MIAEVPSGFRNFESSGNGLASHRCSMCQSFTYRNSASKREEAHSLMVSTLAWENANNFFLGGQLDNAPTVNLPGNPFHGKSDNCVRIFVGLLTA